MDAEKPGSTAKKPRNQIAGKQENLQNIISKRHVKHTMSLYVYSGHSSIQCGIYFDFQSWQARASINKFVLRRGIPSRTTAEHFHVNLGEFGGSDLLQLASCCSGSNHPQRGSRIANWPYARQADSPCLFDTFPPLPGCTRCTPCCDVRKCCHVLIRVGDLPRVGACPTLPLGGCRRQGRWSFRHRNY